MAIKIIVNGASGKMGSVSVSHVKSEPDFKLVGESRREDDLGKIIRDTRPDIVIDFTTPAAVFNNAKIILENQARPIIGTTGLTEAEIHTLKKMADDRKIGAVIAPNFALGAILMMQLAQELIPYFPDAEIVEMHHEKKKDAPSGTAIKTAQLMVEKQKHRKDIPIHSVRLPGLFSTQSVIFGALGETLTIRHDCLDRQAMMPGLSLACRKVMSLDRLIYGLDQLL